MRSATILGAAVLLCAAPATARSFSACLSDLRTSAAQAGVGATIVAEALDLREPDERVLRLSEMQPEFRTPIWDYLAFLVDAQRIADGQAMMRRHDDVLRTVEERYGVDRHVVAAVWGVETDYGRRSEEHTSELQSLMR